MLEDDSFQATLGYQTKVPVMMIENENSVTGRQVASDTVTTVAGPGTGSQRNYQCLPSARLHWSSPTLGPEEVSHLRRIHRAEGGRAPVPRCSLPGLLAT